MRRSTSLPIRDRRSGGRRAHSCRRVPVTTSVVAACKAHQLIGRQAALEAASIPAYPLARLPVASLGFAEHDRTCLLDELRLGVGQQPEALADVLWDGDLPFAGDAHRGLLIAVVLLVRVRPVVRRHKAGLPLRWSRRSARPHSPARPGGVTAPPVLPLTLPEPTRGPLMFDALTDRLQGLIQSLQSH